MSASDQMRAMLDQLMGTSRNGDVGQSKLSFSDPRVCKSFLLSCCPHEILASTRMDLGECPKVHEFALRADFEAAQKRKDYFYDIDAMEHLSSFIADCDRRTELAKKRLAETQEDLSAEVATKAEKVHELAEVIGKKLAHAESLGAEGKVTESMKLMEEVEDVRKKKAAAELEYRNSMPASSYQQQKLRVCEVCSAYLGIHDNDRRLADHFGGKLHLGFIKIREKLENLIEGIEERKRKKRESSEAGAQEYEREKTRDRDRDDRRRSNRDDRYRRRSGSRSRSSRRSRDRDGRDRHRRSRDGSRERSRRHRSRSRDRKERRRSRSRDRRSGRRRSRSRDDHRRASSRSRDDYEYYEGNHKEKGFDKKGDDNEKEPNESGLNNDQFDNEDNAGLNYSSSTCNDNGTLAEANIEEQDDGAPPGYSVY